MSRHTESFLWDLFRVAADMEKQVRIRPEIFEMCRERFGNDAGRDVKFIVGFVAGVYATLAADEATAEGEPLGKARSMFADARAIV
jgi:hypothetical protein